MNFGYPPFRLALSGVLRVVRRLARAADGVETIEFALISIALFTFLFGVIEFGRLYWVQSTLQYAAEAAARYCTVNSATCSDATIGTYAATKTYGISVPTTGVFHVTPYNAATNTPACGNQVTVSYTFNFIAAGLLFSEGSIPLSLTACHQA